MRGGTRVAVVVDVEVNRTTGKVWTRRFYVAHDCGQVIAPDQLRQTLEAQVVQTASRAMMEEVKFDNKNVTSVAWNTYWSLFNYSACISWRSKCRLTSAFR